MRSRRGSWKRSRNGHYGLALFHSRDNGAAMYPPSPPYKISLKEKKRKIQRRRIQRWRREAARAQFSMGFKSLWVPPIPERGSYPLFPPEMAPTSRLPSPLAGFTHGWGGDTGTFLPLLSCPLHAALTPKSRQLCLLPELGGW